MSSLFESLSDKQREIVFDKRGKFVVRACPGSGKTYSVAARLAYLLSNWDRKYRGIATISFTNTAWQEIDTQIKTHFGLQASISYPHFLGTIDSFINHNIFLPFGHLALKCMRRPELVGEPHGVWHGRNYFESLFDNISINIHGNFIIFEPKKMPKDWKNNEQLKKRIFSTKKSLLKAGYAIQHDADYFAMILLEKYPQVASALVYRYPVLIVDEAQDTSAIQMKVIDLLIENGLQEIILVGDPDQAIFEWNEANPQLFQKKYEEWKDNSIVLNENRRSSTNICDCTCRLSTLNETSSAINEDVKDFPFVPIVVTYDPHNINSTIQYFLSLCQEHEIEINKDNVAVIYRSKDIFRLITGIELISSNPWKDNDYYTQDFARGKYLFDRANIKKGFQLIEKAFVRILTNNTLCSQEAIEKRINEVGFAKHRKEVYQILSLLPETRCNIGAWVEKGNDNFRLNGINIILSIRNSHRDFSFEQLIRDENEAMQSRDYRLGTVHSVKGETFEAVLLFLKQRGIGANYKTLLRDNVTVTESEELRIVYVGLTRPRRILLLAVPDEDDRHAWESKLNS